jgi:hypothetical protein
VVAQNDSLIDATHPRSSGDIDPVQRHTVAVAFEREAGKGRRPRRRDSIENAGCKQLLEAVLRTRPRLRVFGHIHGAHGIVKHGETLFVNAALMGVGGSLSEFPVVVQVSRS